MKFYLMKGSSLKANLVPLKDVIELVEEECQRSLEEWLMSIHKGSDKSPVVHYCRQGTFNKLDHIGMHFSAHDFQRDARAGHAMIVQGFFLYNTFFLKSHVPCTFGLPGSTLVHVFQQREVLYCQLCYHNSSPLKPSLFPITYKDKVSSALINHMKGKHQNVERSNMTLVQTRNYNRQVCFAVASNNLPFRIIDDEAFRAILKSSSVPHRTSLSTVHLTSLYNDFKDSLKASIGKNYIHISFDLWSSITMNHYLVLSCQWISPEWIIERAGLSILDLDGQCADDIVTAVESILDNLGIEQKAIFSIVTDGAANEVSAANYSGFCDEAEHVWCYLHKLNLCIADGFAEKQNNINFQSNKSKARSDKEFYKQFHQDNRSSFLPYTRDRSKALET